MSPAHSCTKLRNCRSEFTIHPIKKRTRPPETFPVPGQLCHPIVRLRNYDERDGANVDPEEALRHHHPKLVHVVETSPIIVVKLIKPIRARQPADLRPIRAGLGIFSWCGRASGSKTKLSWRSSSEIPEGRRAPWTLTPRGILRRSYAPLPWMNRVAQCERSRRGGSCR